MGWQDTSVPMLRVLLDDLGSQPVYTDSRLQELLVVSARYVEQEVTFSTSYTMDVVNCSITPEPDDNFINLMVLKAACLLTRGTQRLSAINSFIIHDGTSKIDGKQPALSNKDVANNYCQEYADAVEQYTLGNAVVGKAIFGPSNISIPSTAHSARSRF